MRSNQSATVGSRRSLPGSDGPNRDTIARQRKRLFKIAEALRHIREAVRPFPKAMLFELAERGFDSVFDQLIACIISIRTRDEVSLQVALRLFEAAHGPREVAKLQLKKLTTILHGCAFSESKAKQIHAIAVVAANEYAGKLPCDADVLMAMRGVGPKCANLALGIACGESLVGVDIHVHRIVNRWGYVQATTPEQTMAALMQKLPRRYWIEINSLLVPFGKHICTGQSPRCSTCPVLDMCKQIAVTKHR